MTVNVEAQRATLDKFIDAWKRSSAADMVATWSDDCTQRTLPFSLGHAARNRTEVMATLPMLQKAVRDYELTIHEVVHDVPQRKAVVYALSTGKTSFGDWASDYAVFFTFDESGEKIVKLEEMIDSAFMKDFFPKFQGYMREQMAAPQAS